MHGIGTTAQYDAYRIGSNPVNFQSNSSSGSGSSTPSSRTSAKSSDCISLTSLDLRSNMDEDLIDQLKIEKTELVKKYLSTLGPLYKFTAMRIKSGQLAPEDAIKNELLISDEWEGADGSKHKKNDLDPIIKDFIVAGLVTFQKVQKLSALITSRGIANLRHQPLERLFLSGALSLKQALKLDASDLSYLSKPETQDWILSRGGSVFLALI